MSQAGILKGIRIPRVGGRALEQQIFQIHTALKGSRVLHALGENHGGNVHQALQRVAGDLHHPVGECQNTFYQLPLDIQMPRHRYGIGKDEAEVDPAPVLYAPVIVHGGQAVAIGKGMAVDHLYSCGDSDLGEGAAPLERRAVDLGQRSGEGDSRQIDTALKGSLIQSRNALGDHGFGQTQTILKGLPADVLNRGGDLHAAELGAALKGHSPMVVAPSGRCT